jgi:hypothetical protein
MDKSYSYIRSCRSGIGRDERDCLLNPRHSAHSSDQVRRCSVLGQQKSDPLYSGPGWIQIDP